MGIGYHFFVRKDGSVYRGRPETVVGAHAGNNSYDSIGICFEGNFMTETMGDAQRKAGQELVQYLKDKYGITKVQKHSDVNATGCPGTRFPFKEISPRWHDNGKAHRERRRRLYGGVSAAKSAR